MAASDVRILVLGMGIGSPTATGEESRLSRKVKELLSNLFRIDDVQVLFTVDPDVEVHAGIKADAAFVIRTAAFSQTLSASEAGLKHEAEFSTAAKVKSAILHRMAARIRNTITKGETYMTSPKCPQCNAPFYELTDNFCHSCRADLTGMHTTCTKCGFSAVMPAEVKYCPICGQERATFEEPSSPVSAQAPA